MSYRCSSFSIIFKSEIFLRGLIDNILEQKDFDDIEFIFLNPNSPDRSEEILLPYLEKFPNFKYIKLENDPGLYECWNICVKNTTTNLITNWNPDDRRTKDSIKRLKDELLFNTNYDLVYGLTYITENLNEKVENCKSDKIYPAYEFSIESLFTNNSPHCMPMWRKSIHEKSGYFDNSYQSAGDGDMWLRAAINGSRFLFLQEIVGSYYESDYTVSRNKNKIDFLIKEVNEMRAKNLQTFLNKYE